MKKGLCIIVIGIIVVITACTSKTSSQGVGQAPVSNSIDNGYGKYSNDANESTSTSDQVASQEAHVPLPPQSYMDAAEDAYEEGRALREEANLSGNPNLNEGDYDDEDYDDDYEDGWED